MNALSAYISPAGRRHDKTRIASHQASAHDLSMFTTSNHQAL
ncbi:hypothetical protein HMPREF3040_03352 [Escherichia coli]|nr:hypothetical protein HMPREF3040_03352 [Escherichia coli]